MAAQTPQCLFPFYTIGFALGDEPTLASYSAEDAALDDLLAETLQQLILVLIRSQNHACHVLTPSRVYSISGIKSQTRSILTGYVILVNSLFSVHDVVEHWECYCCGVAKGYTSSGTRCIRP